MGTGPAAIYFERPESAGAKGTIMLQTWQFWALSSAVFAALTAIFAKIGVTDVNSDMATLIRTAIILPLTLAVALGLGNWQSPGLISGRSWLFLAVSGLATGASWICYFRALKLGNASQVAPIDKLSVVFVAILAALLLGERLSMQGWAGVVLIAAGAVVLAAA
jgi:transporter family protein